MGRTRHVTGGNNVELSLCECGNPNGRSIPFIHGFCQSYLAWKYQMDRELANEFRMIALDPRGHGMSGKPVASNNYTDGHFWANDIAAVMSEFGLEKPTLVGWSYGGYIVGDYLQRLAGRSTRRVII